MITPDNIADQVIDWVFTGVVVVVVVGGLIRYAWDYVSELWRKP